MILGTIQIKSKVNLDIAIYEIERAAKNCLYNTLLSKSSYSKLSLIRLDEINKYLKKEYHLSYKQVLFKAFNNLNIEETSIPYLYNITLNKNIPINSPIFNAIKIIKFGNLSVQKCDVLDKIIKLAAKYCEINDERRCMLNEY